MDQKNEISDLKLYKYIVFFLQLAKVKNLKN